MSGGFKFNITKEQVKAHILSKYSKSLTTMGIKIPEELELTLMGYGDVEISKNAFFAKDFRPEQVVVVRLGSLPPVGSKDTVTYYAIVRCANIGTDSSCSDGRGIEKSTVLFVNDRSHPKSVERISYYLTKDYDSTGPVIEKRKAVIEKRKAKYPDEDVNMYFDNHVWFEVKNSISSTDTYNIFVDNRVSSNKSLLNFFYTLLYGFDHPVTSHDTSFKCLIGYHPRDDEILMNWNDPQQTREQLRS
jgi:hypothetical protein